MIFKNNKYTKWYFKIINSGLWKKPSNGYYERHHIIPKCFGGSNDTSNLVYLTAKQHFICHVLLPKMVEENKAYKMYFALHAMKMNSKYHRRMLTAAQYAFLREKIGNSMKGKNNPSYGLGYKFKGANNHFFGKHHSIETRKKLSTIHTGKRTGTLNPFFGKKHSEETKHLLAKQRNKNIKVKFTHGIEYFENYYQLGEFIGKSKWLGSKLCLGLNNSSPTYKHLWVKYNIESIQYAT